MNSKQMIKIPNSDKVYDLSKYFVKEEGKLFVKMPYNVFMAMRDGYHKRQLKMIVKEFV